MKTVPSGPVEWRARRGPNLYPWERQAPEDLKKRRQRGVIVKAQTWHRAIQLAAAQLQLAPEHVEVERKDEEASSLVPGAVAAGS